MSGMGQDVPRWQPPDRASVPSNRWTGWAQSVRERHGRILLRHHGVGMALAQPPERLYVSCQRWEHAAWTLCPQIHLAISPILRQTVWRGAPVLPMPQACPASPRPPSLIGQRAPAQQPAERWAVERDLADVNPLGEQQPLVLPALDTDWHMPLKRVFARVNVEDVHETVTVSQVTRQSLVAQQSLQMLRRVVEERQRVEAWERRAIMTRQQKEVTPVVTAAEAREVVMHSPRGPRVGGSGITQTASPPAIDLEQLTEQVVRHIDSRIVAHRERLGRPF
jgi:hypothetical protein